MLVFVKVPSLSSNEGDNSFWSKTSSISLNFDAQEVTTKKGNDINYVVLSDKRSRNFMDLKFSVCFMHSQTTSKALVKAHQRISTRGHLLFSLNILVVECNETPVANTQVKVKESDISYDSSTSIFLKCKSYAQKHI